MVVSVLNPKLRKFEGKTVAQIAQDGEQRSRSMR